jgi:hypothetical protein
VNLALSLLVSGTLAAMPTDPTNLDFASGSFVGWEGKGFYVTTATGKGPSLKAAVCSSDVDKPGSTGLLHRTFVLPPGSGVLRFTAAVSLGQGCALNPDLDIVLVGPGNKVIPKFVQTPKGWQPVRTILQRDKGRPREYLWFVTEHAGRPLRIALLDQDNRPGCHLFCGGFRLVTADDWNGAEFGKFMLDLAREHKLPPVARYDSKHFMALSNADDAFSELRLHNCELMYDVYYEHFGKKGFTLHEPTRKLMVAIFDSQYGIEAYIGSRLPPTITGLYHPGTNRLVVYDYGLNNDFVAQKRLVPVVARRIRSDLDRRRFIETMHRRAEEFRTEANIGTVMHEVAHQLSFNSGMFNRTGDTPVWLAEGMACYCESTVGNAWQGPGEPNPERLQELAGPAHGRGRFIPLLELITHDEPLRDRRALLGYAQSWALFTWLMEERPQQLRTYLALVYKRKAPDHRLADFGQVFGSDIQRLELRYTEWIKQNVEKHWRPRR